MECNLLFNFNRVHKYLYIHLQRRKLVPKPAGVYVMSFLDISLNYKSGYCVILTHVKHVFEEALHSVTAPL